MMFTWFNLKVVKVIVKYSKYCFSVSVLFVTKSELGFFVHTKVSKSKESFDTLVIIVRLLTSVNSLVHNQAPTAVE